MNVETHSIDPKIEAPVDEPIVETIEWTDESLRSSVRVVLRTEAEALLQMEAGVDGAFVDALRLLGSAKGKVVLTGVGKSGLIARKIAATLSSTGTVATFLHPSDGLHGDLGVVGRDDVVLAISKSGESDEIGKLMPAIKRLGVKLVAITSREDSQLAQGADVALVMPDFKEACPMDLAPTTSTTVALAIGDALAVTLMKVKGFKAEDFALYHPGGKLGKRLLLRVSDLMIPLEKSPVLHLNSATMQDAIFALSKYGLGIVIFCEAGEVQAILTDGDIRRLLNQHGERFFGLPLADLVNRTPITLAPEVKAVEALRFMEDRERPLNVLPIVVDGRLVGVLRLHELLSVA